MLLFCGVGHPGNGSLALLFQMLDSTQTVRLAGLPLSLLALSFHCLVTLNVVVSGVCVFVTWKSFSLSVEESVGLNTHPLLSVPAVPVSSAAHPLVV